MNNTPDQQHEQDVPSTTVWTTSWACPHCQRAQIATAYGAYSCGCGTRFDVRRQPYGSKIKEPYVIMLPRQVQRPWPAYETK